MMIVAWLALWSFGNDVGGGLVVVVIVVGMMVAWLAVVVIWGAKLVVVMVVEIWLVQNNDRKRKTYLKGSQPGEHEEFSRNNGGEIYLNTNLAA